MKKIISLASGIVLAFGIGAAGAYAQTPAINYNGEPQAIENIRNVDGRVQLPFRAVFEMMGATVDYEDATRKVTATRDGKTVEFFANGSELTVTDENGTSVIPAEIGFDYERNRVMVPVRFVSNALGSRVGWDDSTKTVFILDTYKLAEELKANCPEIARLLEISKDVETDISSSGTASMSLFMTPPETGKAVALNLDLQASGDVYENIGKANVSFDLTHENLNELTNINLGQLKDASFNVIKTDSAIYFNTNIVAKLNELLPDASKISQIQSYIKPDTWFRLDYSFIEKKFGTAIADSIFKGTPLDAEAFYDYLIFAFDSEKDVTQDEMIGIITAFDLMEEMFSTVNITETEPGSYTITMAMTEDDIISFFLPEGYSDFDSALYETLVAEIKNMFDFKMDCNLSLKDGVYVNQDMNFAINMKQGGVNLLAFSMDLNSTSSKSTKAPEITVPENSLSVESVLTLLGI